MTAVHTAVRATLTATGHLAPPLAVRLATAAFTRVGPALPVHARDEAVHASARRGTLEVRGETAVTYAWGDAGAPAVLLVHGWQSRASRFSPLVSDLLAVGLRAVAFDGVGHGDSSGRRTTILDQLEIIRRLADAEPAAFSGVVGHSFGGLAAGLALHEGVPADRYAGIAAVSGWDPIIDGFAGQVGLPFRLRGAFSRHVARTAFPRVASPAQRFDLARRPVPATVPALFVHDTLDSQVPLDEAARLHEAHPGSRLHVTTGLGHNRVLADPGVREAVLEHLDRPDRATGLAAAS